MVMTFNSNNYPGTFPAGTTPTVTVLTTFSLWSNNAGTSSPITVALTDAICDCNGLIWSVSTATDITQVLLQESTVINLPAPTYSEANKGVVASFTNCYDESDVLQCDTTGQYASSDVFTYT